MKRFFVLLFVFSFSLSGLLAQKKNELWSLTKTTERVVISSTKIRVGGDDVKALRFFVADTKASGYSKEGYIIEAELDSLNAAMGEMARVMLHKPQDSDRSLKSYKSSGGTDIGVFYNESQGGWVGYITPDRKDRKKIFLSETEFYEVWIVIQEYLGVI